MDGKAFLKWFSAVGVAALTVALTFTANALAGFDPATVTSDPVIAAVVVAVITALTRAVNHVIGKLGT
jgi:hypothetical protein